jgi:hypothetical protein
MMVNGVPEMSLLSGPYVSSDLNEDSLGDLYPEHAGDRGSGALSDSAFGGDQGEQLISMTNPMSASSPRGKGPTSGIGASAATPGSAYTQNPIFLKHPR